MFKNYLKTAWRSLVKRKGYTLINILGLSSGMAICLLIVLFISDELNFDRFHEKGDNIYRMVVKRQYPGRTASYAIIPQSYAYAVKQELPEVEETVRVFSLIGDGTFQLKYGERSFEEKRVLAADSNFFRVFSARMLAGNKEEALNKANSIVLNETTAKKYFGSAEEAIGKMLQPEGENNDPLKVTGVIADWPESSHFLFDILYTTVGIGGVQTEDYTGFSNWTYLLLNKNTTQQAVEAKFPHIIEKYASGNIAREFSQTYEQFQANGNGYTYSLQPLKEIHLTSSLEQEHRSNGSLRSVYIFGAVAVFILLIACINFINLSTARSVERAKEVGIRKTFGSGKRSLINQFLMESAMLSLFSMVIAMLLVLLLLPFFNQVSGKTLQFSAFFSARNISFILLLTILTGLAAGFYPAFVLSSFRPVQVLKGKFKSGSYGLTLRNGLVVFQFAVSVILIICTLIVNRQMSYMTSGDRLGFDKENTIIIERADLLNEQTIAFKTELQRMQDITAVAGASALPGQERYFGISWTALGSQQPMTGRGIVVDEEYQKTLRLEMKEGRFFSRDFPTDSLAVVLNEKAVAELGLNNPVGARLTTNDQFLNGGKGETYTYTVIGVIKDFHYQSLHQMVSPLVFTSAARFRYQNNYLAVKIKSAALKTVVDGINSKWQSFIKDRPLRFSFLDKTVEQQYYAEQTAHKIFTFFSTLAIFIACIGLLGLSAYATQQRTREIGIRKVLGASVGNIVRMLSVDSLKLVLISVAIAFPAAWWVMHTWLQDFAYRVSIGWWVFALAGILAMAVALLTIGFQSIKAAVANPVKALRSE